MTEAWWTNPSPRPVILLVAGRCGRGVNDLRMPPRRRTVELKDGSVASLPQRHHDPADIPGIHRRTVEIAIARSLLNYGP